MRTFNLILVSFVLSCGGDGSDAQPDSGSEPDKDASMSMLDAGEQTPDASGGMLDAGMVSAAGCFADAYENQVDGADYDMFSPTVAIHCTGTDHQEITGIERVVFLGDSITVGTPPTPTRDYYRSELADMLVNRFGLDAPNGVWESANPATGQSTIQDSGDFSSCAEWGARTDDLASQIGDCFPASERDKRTLVIVTMGGNDIASIAKDGIDGNTPLSVLMNDAEQFVQYMRDAVEWFYEDPSRFPNGVFVIFANVYEYTDATVELMSCPGAGLAGFDGEWSNPDDLKDLILWINEQYMSIAVDTGTDMLFMQEQFCGHGFNYADPAAPCYRGGGGERWFDDTCIHPNPRGHDELASMFMNVVDE